MLMAKIQYLEIICILLMQFVAFAAVPSDVYEQQQRAKRQEQEQQQRISEERAIVPVPEHSLSPLRDNITDETRFFIRNFIIDDCGTQHFQWLSKYIEEYNGKIVTFKEVFLIQKRLSDAILKHGYATTQVLIPEQDFQNSKTFKFIVVPGYIEGIYFEDYHVLGSISNAFPCGKGSILNSFKLEQGLEQMRRAGNQNITMDIVPGTKPGWSNIILNVQRTDPWSVDLSWDDAGQKSTGKKELNTSLTYHNPTGLNDILVFGYTQDTVNHDKEFGIHNNNFYYSVPFKDFTFTASKYYNSYRQTIPMPYDDIYRYEGKTDTWELGINSLLYRDNIRKTQLVTKLIRKHKRGEDNLVGRLDSQELDTAAFQIGINHRQYERQSMLDFLIYLQKGIPSCGAKPGIEDDIEDGARTRYKMFGWNFYYGTPVKLGSWKTKFSSTFRGQLTSDHMYGIEHISIGGRYSIHGFDGENTLAAENGYILRNEYAFQMEKLKQEIYFGLDYGKVWGLSDKFNIGDYLIGAYAGLRGTLGKQLNYDVFIGTPVKKPKGFKADKTACGFNMGLSL